MQDCAECYLKKDSVIVVSDKLKSLLNDGDKSMGLIKHICACVWEQKDRDYC